jgi:hypothetical protein
MFVSIASRHSIAVTWALVAAFLAAADSAAHTSQIAIPSASRAQNVPAASQSELEIPSVAAQPNRSSIPQASTNELTLPPAFVGCWRSVTNFANEGVESIRTTGPYAWWIACVVPPGTTTFCYKQASNGRFEPTLFSGDVSPEWTARQKITGLTYDLEVLSTDARRSARLRGRSHHVEFGNRTIDETWEMNCRIDHSRMTCREIEASDLNGKPWCFSKAVSLFNRIPE